MRLMPLSGKRESDPQHPPWQGGALPLSYFRKTDLINQYVLKLYYIVKKKSITKYFIFEKNTKNKEDLRF